jgi:hypothetical protein
LVNDTFSLLYMILSYMNISIFILLLKFAFQVWCLKCGPFYNVWIQVGNN